MRKLTKKQLAQLERRNAARKFTAQNLDKKRLASFDFLSCYPYLSVIAERWQPGTGLASGYTYPIAPLMITTDRVESYYFKALHPGMVFDWCHLVH
jgi:hypothetical protein